MRHLTNEQIKSLRGNSALKPLVQSMLIKVEEQRGITAISAMLAEPEEESSKLMFAEYLSFVEFSKEHYMALARDPYFMSKFVNALFMYKYQDSVSGLMNTYSSGTKKGILDELSEFLATQGYQTGSETENIFERIINYAFVQYQTTKAFLKKSS